jgi:hypothetical protein
VIASQASALPAKQAPNNQYNSICFFLLVSQGTVPQAWAGMKSLEEITLFENAGLKGCLPAAFKTRAVKLGQEKSSSSSSSEEGSKKKDHKHDDQKSAAGAAAVAAAAVVNTGITGWC